MERLRGFISLVVVFLMCVTVGLPMVAEGASSGSVPCNEFKANEQFGVITSDCSGSDGVVNDLLGESGTLGLMGRFNQTNNTISGRFAQFTLNEQNMSIDSYAVWSGGSLHQVLDMIAFYDTTEMRASINGPIFNGTFDSTNIRIQNHPSGLVYITTEKSIRIKLTMSGGVNYGQLASGTLNQTFDDAMYIRGNNVSAAVMVRQGAIEPAGNRSIFVDLAKGGQMIFRTGSDNSDVQRSLIDSILGGTVIAEYWALTRDEGAIYTMMTYDDVNFNDSTFSVRLGDWSLKLPKEAAGKVTLIHMDRMSLTVSGGADDIFSGFNPQAEEVDNVSEVLAAAKNGSGTPLYSQETYGTGINLALYLPGQVTGGTTGNTTGDDTPDNQASLNISPTMLVVGGIAAIAVVAGAALLVKRSRK